MENSVRYILLIIGVFIILGILWDGLRRKKRQEREAPIGTIDLKRMKEKMPHRSFSTSPVSLSEPEDDIVGEVRSVGRETASVGEQAILQEEIALAEPVVKPTPVVQTVQAVQTVKQAAQLGPLVQEGFVMLHLKSSYEEGMGGYTLLQTLLANHLQFGAKQFFHCYENNNPKAKVLFSVSSDEAPGTFNPTAMRDFHCQGLMLFMNAGHHKQPLRVFEAMLETAESLAEALDADIFINQDQPCDEAHLAQLRSELK